MGVCGCDFETIPVAVENGDAPRVSLSKKIDVKYDKLCHLKIHNFRDFAQCEI